ncbi:glycosyltransferase involved in cell wall biosynthesis [Lipingzhangella halophila]|uniref:Glycosyltransferase involved in cell wall biosynthesis n=1 Tax=Lipingzhangella halophila TaxID=1783352 RepID=A0A7W7RFK6_9ACTN|nr:glycosyltransferase family 4 protein [Lipingzhangella halophila]MBB4931012.1 glycosyltransferase involved in cell wall biosynthesis [Lipingzhangella halophila]
MPVANSPSLPAPTVDAPVRHGPRAKLADAYDAAVHRLVKGAFGLSPSGRARALRIAAADRAGVLPRFPALALALLVADDRANDARGVLNRLADSIDPTSRRGRSLNRRLAATMVALRQPRLTEVAARRLRVPHRYTGPIHGGAAARTARLLFQRGAIAEAIDTVAPYVHLHEVCGLLHQRYIGERAALGPLPESPAPDTAAPAPVPGRVLHLVSNALPHAQAGYTVRTHRIVSAQRTLGLDPHVATFVGWPRDVPDAPHEDVLDGISYHHLRPGEKLPEGLARQIDAGVSEAAGLARRLRPAVLHAASDHRNGSVAMAVGARLGLPVVYEVRGFLEETWLSAADPRAEGSERHRLVVEREAAVMRGADAVVTLAGTMREEIVARGADPERVVLAPNAVDPHLLDTQPDGAGFRRAHGIGDDEFVVGSVSSLMPYEGFATLVDAAALLRESGIRVRVLLVGDGADRDALVTRVAGHGLSDVCVLPGRVPPEEALRAQAALDVFVAPRADERVCRLVTPLKPVEAMALGVPVVASDLPALRELLADGEAGRMVPPGDAAALAEALGQLRDDTRLRNSLSKAGRDEVAAHRTWPRVAEVYRDLYARLGSR